MKLALVGATGAVGETFLRVVEERAVPVTEMAAFASRDHGRTVRFRGSDLPVQTTGRDALAGYDVVVFASSEDASAEYAPGCVEGGAVVIDNSATFRLRDDAPLVVPEINAHAVQPGHRLFPVANCSAIVLVMALAPILRTAGLRSVRIATYQAASGAGRAGLDELTAGERALHDGGQEPEPHVFPTHLARNVVPQVGAFDAAGDSVEELKVAAETRKILEQPGLHVAATTVRVPVRTAHALAAFVETERDTSVAELANGFAGFPGVTLHAGGIVTPRDVEGSDLVHVARLRAEGESRRHFQLWAVGDQLRKGAATNAVQILELLLARAVISAEGAAVRT